MGCRGYEALYWLSVDTTARCCSMRARQEAAKPKLVGGPVYKKQREAEREKETHHKEEHFQTDCV